MKALIANYLDAGGVFYINSILFNSNGSINTAGLAVCTPASDSPADIQSAIQTTAIVFAAGLGFTITAADVISEVTPAFSFNNAASHSFTTSTGATGFQVSASRNVMVNYSVTIATTATIGGSASGTVVLEVASTNSSTPSDWVEIARFTNSQSITLALALQSVQTLAGLLMGLIPTGYYVKLRTINNSGTPSYTFNSGQEVLV